MRCRESTASRNWHTLAIREKSLAVLKKVKQKSIWPSSLSPGAYSKELSELWWRTPGAPALWGRGRQKDQGSGSQLHSELKHPDPKQTRSSSHTNTCIHMLTGAMLTVSQKPAGRNKSLSMDRWMNNRGMCIYKMMDHKEWSSDTWNNMSQPWKDQARLMKSDAKDTKWSHLYNIFIDGFIHWDLRSMAAKGCLGWSHICS